jgi:hypothetical protein
MNPNWNNVPFELRQLKQWVCTNADKVPLNPITKKGASPTDPKTWGTFQQACEAGMPAIGFVITAQDPYTFIDLDHTDDLTQLTRQTKIYESFNSYSERSVSGKGAHIIVKGRIPAGVRRDKVEVYSAERYMICTGDILRNAPINDYQALLDVLYNEMQSTAPVVELQETEADFNDEDIVDRAMRASNADKFNSLCAGEIAEYPSQSEADFALLSIIAFYTKSNEQVRRIFRMTKLGKREKAIKNNTYLDFALRKVRAQQPEPIDMSQVSANAMAIMKPKIVSMETPHVPIKSDCQPIPIELPPGLVGEIAQYFYQSSIRPVAEISMVAAIACVAGVAGRAYNISGQGLSQYLILLARTGTGKEAASSGISRLFQSIRPMLPMSDQFLGPSVFASGPALQRVLSERPCFVSILGEFGYTVQRLSSPNANSAELTLKQLLLDVYGKSGFGQTLQASVYSDKEKNVNPVASPNITILGESTPESFYEGLDQSHIASGFLSRFLILEYTGDRPELNDNHNMPPSDQLKQKFADLMTVVITTTNNNTCLQVKQDKEAQDLLTKFNLKVDGKIRAAGGDAIREIWNRAHLKALKLAALISVGNNPHMPLVDALSARWAIHMVESDCQALQKRFSAGDIGTGDSKQINDVKRIIENYLSLPFGDVVKYGATEKLYKAHVVPYQFIIKKTYSLSSFKNDRLGSTVALKRTIQTMMDMGMLKEIPKAQLEQAYEYTGGAYSIGRHW